MQPQWSVLSSEWTALLHLEDHQRLAGLARKKDEHM
jgi:hypothetical protein